MILILNVGRFAMIAWIVYALVLIFAPALLHRPPDQMSGAIQAIGAFALGHLMDRAIGMLRRRRAEAGEAEDR